MTTHRLLSGLALFALLSGAGVVNVLLMQPQSKAARPKATTAVAVSQSLSDVSVPAQRVPNPAPAPETRQGVVRELYNRGYLSTTDGEIGLRAVEAAILAFEHDHGLALTAEPSEAVLQALILGAGGGAERAGSATAGPVARRLTADVEAALRSAGAPGGELSAAIRSFEREHRLTESGRISAPLVQALARVAASKGVASPLRH